jgi:serine/threonine protein kinase
LKLSDFGSANNIDEGGTRITYAGTMIYMAPEMVTNEPYNTSLDLWNVGLIIYELLTGENPFEKAREMTKL